MGRTRSFDETETVLAARQVFWEHGFAETSIPELETATGLNRSSLYHSFGSKRGLFDAAVQSYLDQVVRPRLVPLTAPTVDPGALAEYLSGFRAAIAEPASALASNGCLLLNSSVGSLGQDEAVRHSIDAYRAELGAALARGVSAAHPELAASQAQALTVELSGLMLAAMALVRVAPDAAVEMLDVAQALA